MCILNTSDCDLFFELSNWLTNQYFENPINITKRNDFFCNNNITGYKNNIKADNVSKTISYSYIYNYLYFLEKCIKELDSNFSFSNYNNVYEIKDYIDTLNPPAT